MVIAKNPILPGFYPDPSICRVGNDFYMVCSSFAYFPGIPIFHSKDLAHWEQIGNVIDRPEQLPMGEDCGEDDTSRGIFAPTIRYHDGMFYVVATNVSEGGNFIVTARTADGAWSNPHFLGEKAAGIDPSLFFDEDGICYYIGTRPNPRGVRYNGDWEIWMQKIDLEHMKLIGKDWAIWRGALREAVWPEGPHLYKKGGDYYLLHAEGGTGSDHAVCVARSIHLTDRFVGCLSNPIFTHRNLGKDYPVCYTGHGDLTEDGFGNWYMVLLASATCQQHTSLGRETFLAKVTWEDDWPVINAGIGRLEGKVAVPLQPTHFVQEVHTQDYFQFFEDKLDPRFIGFSGMENWYSLKERSGFLRLYASKNTVHENKEVSFLGVRQKSYCCQAGAGVDFCHLKTGETAGLVLIQNHQNYLEMVVCKGKEKDKFIIKSCTKGIARQVSEIQLASQHERTMLKIQLRTENQRAQVWICSDDEWKCIANQVDLLSFTTEEAGGFVGCTLGLVCSANGNRGEGYADFAWFYVNGTQE